MEGFAQFFGIPALGLSQADHQFVRQNPKQGHISDPSLSIPPNVDSFEGRAVSRREPSRARDLGPTIRVEGLAGKLGTAGPTEFAEGFLPVLPLLHPGCENVSQ